MSDEVVVNQNEIDKTCEILKKQAESGGYFLNPNTEFVRELAKGLLSNQKRYGYIACPCRLAAGEKEKDLDIICPCDYRDADINRHGACY